MEKKTIKELLAMSHAQKNSYLLALPNAERIVIEHKIFRAMAAEIVEALAHSRKRRT